MTTLEPTLDKTELYSSSHAVAEEHDEAGNSMFGFIIFLLSESVIFLSFFAGYILYRTHLGSLIKVIIGEKCHTPVA